eukprot:m.370352 g.370352  ORF g.370352 m.370352 type:complete len:629 (+) comp20858_c0_seq34:199-2085(+)
MSQFWYILVVGTLALRAFAGAIPLECTPASEEPNWPTYHVMNNVTKDPVTGKLSMEKLNDANAIFEYKGIYHVMCQAGGGNWTHAVSNDLVRWFRVQDALGRGDKDSTWDRFGPCDGTASFPGASQGEAPIIMYGPDCADGTGFPPISAHRLGDYPRAAIARPADPSSPYLLQWIKGPSNATFNGEPCSFPGKVWKSSVGDRFNMLCSPHWTGNWGSVWARYESTDPNLLTWTLADANISNFMPSQHNNTPIDAASGAMFNEIPNAPPGGPTHMVNAIEGQAFWVGTYDETTEYFTITGDAMQYIDIGGGGGAFSGGSAHWAATSNSFANKPRGSDNRLLWVAWVSNNPNVLSLIREVSFDAAVNHLVSRPVAEYDSLHNATFVRPGTAVSLEPGSTKQMPIDESAGGALDVSVSFDVHSLSPTTGLSRFGVAVRAPASGVEGAAQNVHFVVSPVNPDGSRNVTVNGTINMIPNKGAPYPCHRNQCPSRSTRVLRGETLDVRILVDRSVVEVFVMGGRIAWVHADPLFNETKTAVHLYNDGAHVVAASNVRYTTTALLRTCALNTPPPPLTRAQSDVLWHDTCVVRSMLESKTLHQHISLGNACSSRSCLCPMLTTIDSIPTATACHW